MYSEEENNPILIAPQTPFVKKKEKEKERIFKTTRNTASGLRTKRGHQMYENRTGHLGYFSKCMLPVQFQE